MQGKILIIGATGLLGQPVARSLNAAGFAVRVMTRDARKAEGIFGKAFEISVGDPTDSHCLDEALRGCTGAHISLPTDAELPVVEALSRLAPQHGLTRITYISGATVSEANRWFPLIDTKFRAEQALRAGSTPYTIFCPTWIMDSLPLFVRNGQAAVLGQQPHAFHWVSAEDCAQMVAHAYCTEKAANKRFRVLGPEGIRTAEALRRYCAVFHPEVKKVSNMPLWLVGVLAALTRDQGLRTAGAMMAYFEKVGEEGALADPIDLLGAPATTLDQWLRIRKASAN